MKWISLLLLVTLIFEVVFGKSCSICSLLLEDYMDTETMSDKLTTSVRRGDNEDDRTKVLDRTIYGPRPQSDRAIVDSIDSFTNVASTLFGRLFGIVNDRLSKVKASDRHSSLGESRKSEEGTSETVFNLFDTIGSIPMIVNRIKGPHVCIREITSKLSETKQSFKSEKKCQRFRDAYKCIDRKETPNGGRETARIQECCDGFETRDILNWGCDKEWHVTSTVDTLGSLNASLFGLAKESSLSDELIKDDITIFTDSNSVEYFNGDKASYVLNNIVSGAQRNFDWTDGEILKTKAGGEIFISQKENLAGTETYVNCHLIENPNIRTINGFIHVVDGIIQPAVENLLKLLEDDGSFSIFVSLFSNEVRNLLSSNQTFTVFAFSDKIYNSLSQSLQQQIRERSGCVADIVKSHIFYKALCSYELDNQLLTSLAGQMTRAQALTHNGRRTIHVGRARILEKDLFAKNGVVHTVNDIIIKEELLAWDDHLSNYNEPLKDALSSVLVGSSQPITIFVPPAENRTVSSEFAANHLISNRIIKVSNEPTTIITNANSTFFAGHFINRSPLAIRISMGEFDRTRTEQIGCSRIIEDSVHACNAMLHFIDKPLPMVHDNFDTFLAGRPDLSRFYKLWKESSLSNLLWRKDTISVFIPVDDAFSNNYFKKVLTNRKELDIFVKRYIISEPLCKHDLLRNKNEIKIEIHQNLNGETLRTTVTEDNVLLLDGAKVQETDIVLINGVAHVLETTIVKDYISNQPNNSRRRITNLFDLLP